MMTETKNNLKEEATTMENVSLEEASYDAEKATVETGGSTEGDPKKKPARKGKNVLIAVLALLLVAATIIAVAVPITLAKKDEPITSLSTATSPETSVENAAEPGSATATDPPAIEKPFGEIKLAPFTKDIVQGYSSKEELEADLTNVAKYIIGNAIMWNVHHHNQYNANPYAGLNDTASAAVAAGVSASVASATTKSSQQPATRTKGSKTNNQKEDADEADVIKSDGDYIYAAYGDYLVVVDRNGTLITQFSMSNAEPDEWGWVPKHYIKALLATEDHVIVVTEGSVDWEDGKLIQAQGATLVTVFTKPSSETNGMTEVATKKITGYYQDSRWMTDSNSIHILTSAEVTTYELTDAVQVQYFPWMTKVEYVRAASELAESHLIPRFVRAITEGVLVDGQLPTMLRLSAWKAEGSAEPWHFADYYGTFDESLRNLIQLTSIDAGQFAATPADQELVVSTAAAFTPSYTTALYGSDDALVLATETSEWDEATQRARDSLFLLNLNIVSQESVVGAEFHSVAMLEGRKASRFSLDVQGNDLRVATTVQKWFPMDTVWEVCGDQYGNEDPCMVEENWDACFETAIDCPAGKLVKTGCPYTFTCDTDGTEEELSSTDNYVIVLDIEEQGEMMELGRVRIGEPHEVITAVRFGENFSYAMTFDERDPFYVLELNPGQAPTVKGSVTLQGFSRYLHPLNEEQTMLVGIGQNSTGTGVNQVNTGVLISVFDVSDPSNPRVVDSHMLVSPDNSSSYSIAETEAKAVTYSDGKLIIPASIQSNMYYYDDDVAVFNENGTSTTAPEDNFEAFEGFLVLDVGNAERDGIQELFRINHYQEAASDCFYCDGSVYEKRSFLFDDGSLVTMFDRIIAGTNITTGAELWSYEPTFEGEPKDCGCW